MGHGLESVVNAVAPVLEQAISPLAAMIPIVGPAISKGIDMIQKARSLDEDAMNKIRTVKQLADAGVPAAIAAKKNLVAAQSLINKTEKAAELQMKGMSKPTTVRHPPIIESPWSETPPGQAAAKAAKESAKKSGAQAWRDAHEDIPMNLYRAGTMMRY